MADESSTIATAQNGTAQGDSQRPPATETQQPQGSQNTAIDLEKELQRIRSQAGREAAAARQAAEQARQEAAALRQQMRAIQTKDMDEMELSKFQRDEIQQYAASLERELAATRQQVQREKDIAAIISKTGAPREIIEAAEDYGDAWSKAADWLRENATTAAERKQAERAEKQAANAVDTGGGKPHNSADWNTRFSEARKSGSALELARLLVNK